MDLMKPWKRYIYFSSGFLSVAALATYGLYFSLRIYFTLAAQHAYRRVFPAAWIFIATEVGIAVPIMFHSLWSVYVVKPRKRKKLRLRGDSVPTVDVLITCCGEDDDLILNTTRAACSLDYPLDSFRVIVLDDGRSPALYRAVQALSAQYANLHYRSRPKLPGVPHHFKAGNLNYGLEQTLSMEGGRGEFVAALDADMIPEPHWLRAILPHMLADERCALACPPQVRLTSLLWLNISIPTAQSSFTTRLLATLCIKVWISSSTHRSRSRTLWVLHGVLDPDMLFDATPWMTLVRYPWGR